MGMSTRVPEGGECALIHYSHTLVQTLWNIPQSSPEKSSTFPCSSPTRGNTHSPSVHSYCKDKRNDTIHNNYMVEQ